MTLVKNKKLLVLASVILSMGVFTTVVSANHSWGKYHWDISTDESTANPLELGDNLHAPAWNSSLAKASIDWNLSVLINKVVAGTGNTDCSPTSGRIEICNDEYGNNGWLGIASIWATRGRNNHIVQGVVKVNDTYFNTPQYNTQAWRDFVICQEVGHTFGLNHQDENFNNANLGTCMDYTNDPDGTVSGQLDNQHPNQHDYDEMTDIYAHLNSPDDDGGSPGDGNGGNNGGGKGKTKGVGSNINLNNPSEWGQAIRQDAQGNNSLYERDLGNGKVLITHVLWVN